MAVPTTRDGFKDYCLRKLGSPVIEINVDDEQVDDRVDEALRYYYDYHFDGSEKLYYKHQITETDKTNKYIELPENIMGVVTIFPVGQGMNTNNMFNIRYQIALNDLYTLTSQSMVPFYMAMQHMRTLEELLVGQQPLRYNRHRNILHIDMDWDRTSVGEYLVVEAYEIVDPEVYNDVWNDRWLQRYATALIGQQWGSNLTKFTGMTLPGNVQFNGDTILQRYSEEIKTLEDEMINTYSLPVSDMVG